MLWVALHFPCLAPGTLDALAAWACQFTPRVSPEPPLALLAEVQASLRYFGGARNLLARMRRGLAAQGLEASLATAATPRAALWIARSGGLRLEDVPVESVAADASFLKGIGVHTVGGLLRLPREGLAARCGQALVDELDRALGAAPEPREFFAPPASFSARLELQAEVKDAEALLFPARRLLVQLEGLLAGRQAGIRSFSLHLSQGDDFFKVQTNFASPTRDAKRMSVLLREKLARTVLAGPVEAIELRAADFAPLGGMRGGLFGDAAAEAEDWAQLVERLQARLGREAVHGIAAFPDHRPEYAWQRVEPGEWEPREYRQGGPRPAWLLEPRRVAEGELALLAGPERIECGWWDGDEARRDYFVARLAGDALGWVYREDGLWYLHGLFA